MEKHVLIVIFLKFHRYNRYILTTGHFIADTDCTALHQTCQYFPWLHQSHWLHWLSDSCFAIVMCFAVSVW